MSLSALGLVLLAALVHAMWNYYLKKANANRTFWWVVYWMTAVVTVPALLIWDSQAFSNITSIGWLVIFFICSHSCLLWRCFTTGLSP